jgi:hypothetical protein
MSELIHVALFLEATEGDGEDIGVVWFGTEVPLSRHEGRESTICLTLHADLSLRTQPPEQLSSC